jgi:hypothetical protein
MKNIPQKDIQLEAAKETTERKIGAEMRNDPWLSNLLRTAVEQTMDEDGWANLGGVGAYISNSSSFSPINYGYKKLSNLIKETDLFDIHIDQESNQMSIRDKAFKPIIFNHG